MARLGSALEEGGDAHAAADTQGGDAALCVTPDHFVNKGPGRPVFSHRLRMETLAAPFLIVTGLGMLAWAWRGAGGLGPILSQPARLEGPAFWAFFFGTVPSPRGRR